MTRSERFADPALDPVDVGLRVLVDPALVAAVLGRVDRGHQRRAEAAGEMVAGGRDEPVVAVDEVEVEAIAELDPGGEHVGVHPLDPGHELAEVARPARLEHAMDVDAGDDLLCAATPRRRGSARGPRRRARRAPPRACARAGRGRPRSAAGTPRRGSGLGSREVDCGGWGSRLEQWRGVEVRREVAQRGSTDRPAILWPRTGLGEWSSTRCERVVAGLARVVEEGPVARLQREQLAGGARRAPLPAGAPPTLAQHRSSSPAQARRRGRRPAASPRSAGPCPRPSSSAASGRALRLVLGERVAQRQRPDAGAGSARSASSSQTGPSHHQCPSSSVSIAKVSRPGRPLRVAVGGEPGGDVAREAARLLAGALPRALRVVGRRRRSPTAGSRAGTCGGSRRSRGRTGSPPTTTATGSPPSRSGRRPAPTRSRSGASPPRPARAPTGRCRSSSMPASPSRCSRPGS